MVVSGSARNYEDEHRFRELLLSRNLKRLRTNELVCLEFVDSTQSFIKNEMRSQKEGDIVISRIQTEGKGRENRTWISQEGGMWMSISLVPPDPGILPKIPILTAEAVLQTLENFGLKGCNVKEPNDVYYKGRKISGVLADAQIVATISLVYLGVGINVNNDPSLVTDISKMATSFRIETGLSLDLIEFASSFVENLDQIYYRAIAST